MDKTTLAQKAHLLHLQSATLAEGMRRGAFKSFYHGQGVDFSGVREYLPGDDVRAIDWNVTARLGRPYVKLFEEERELSVFLILDASLSMKSGSGRASRLETAVECAGLLALAAFQNASPVGAVIFGGSLTFAAPPAQGRSQVMLLLSEFDRQLKRHGHQAPGSVLDNALQGADRLLRTRTLVLVLSDFRTTGWAVPFGHLCHHHDVVAVRITDQQDERLPPVGSIPFADPESGVRAVLPTSSPRFKRLWSDANYHHLEFWQHECVRHGGAPLVISTNGAPLAELTKFFAARER